MLGWITAIAEAIKGTAKVADNFTDSDNRQKMRLLKDVKSLKKAVNYAEEIFTFTDSSFLPKKENKSYWKLRKKFNEKD